jgi:outer membrane receptor protein involved in Fe transport
MILRSMLLSGSALASVLAVVWGIGAPAFADEAAPSGRVSEVVVTAQRLNAARDSIQPQVGASTYAFDSKQIESMPGGDNASLSQVILQAPGVSQDSFGQLHVRDDHNGLQYRLNGVILPEGLGVFGQALSPRLADSVKLITGALPAQYGLRTAGIIDIRTKTGLSNGGSVSLYGGSQGTIQPSFEYGGSSGALSGFVSGSFLQNDRGIESPDGRATPLHDRTQQVNGFAYLEDILNPSDRLSMILGTSQQHFQIPDRTGQQTLGYTVGGVSAYPSDQLNEQQREVTHYGVVSLLHSADKWTGQVSLFARYSTLDFSPDVVGDILYDGIAQTAHKKDVAGGVQAEGVYTLSEAHTLRGGVIVQIDRSTSQTTSQVLPLNADGSQSSTTPLTIVDNGGQTAQTYSVYVQDEWKLTERWVLNYGLRFDRFDGYRDESQLSPRVNLVWTESGLTVHGGYARYFSPPPFELVASQTVGKFVGTSAAAPGTANDTPYAERSDYFDVGFVDKLTTSFSFGLDGYHKQARDLIDEGQFGAPIILTPFNYRDGFAYGLELSLNYAHGPLQAYANLTAEKAQGRDIVSSQFSFDPDELAYIKSHYIYLDHDQTYSASAGVTYAVGDGAKLGADLIYGSGLRKDGAVPNGAEVGPYTQVNLTASKSFDNWLPGGPLELRVDVVNLFDDVYLIRDGTGVGVGAPQYGPRRGVFFGVRKSF